ncbi:hypothetical protein, partial [Streptococcus oralis]|uniref:hypothetical protein n=1 Tax=Streptococcus oralis TaxID=1303 RepID=UPI00163974B8
PGHDSVPFPADSTPLFDNGTTVKEVPNVGKFEVSQPSKMEAKRNLFQVKELTRLHQMEL